MEHIEKERESPGNTLSKTTSSGMTNDEYVPILMHTNTVRGREGRIRDSGGGLTPNNILNMLTKHFPLICQGETDLKSDPPFYPP